MQNNFLCSLLWAAFLGLASFSASLSAQTLNPSNPWAEWAVQYDYLQPIDGAHSIIKLAGKYGVLNHKGKVIASPQYDTIQFLGNMQKLSHAFMQKNGKFGFIALSKQSVDTSVEAIYDDFVYIKSYFAYVFAKKNGKWGCLDAKNKVIIDFEQDSIVFITEYQNDRVVFCACKQHLWGTNQYHVPYRFDYVLKKISSCGAGMNKFPYTCLVPSKNRFDKKHPHLVILDTLSRVTILPEEGDLILDYDEVLSTPCDNYQLVRKNKKWGLITGFNNEIVLSKPIYDSIQKVSSFLSYQRSFPESFIVFQDGKSQLYNHYFAEGALELAEIGTDYDQIQKSTSGFILKKNQKYAFYNPSARTLSPFEYESIHFSGKAYILQKGDKWGIADASMQTLLYPFEYTNIQATQQADEFIFQKNQQFMLATDDHLAILPNSDAPLRCSPNGTIWKKTKIGWEYMNPHDKISKILADTFPILADSLQGFEIIQQKGKKFVFYPHTNKIYPLNTYENLRLAGTGGIAKPFLYAQKNGKWGLIDTKDKTFLDFSYDQIHSFDLLQGFFEVSQNGTRLKVNAEGKPFIP